MTTTNQRTMHTSLQHPVGFLHSFSARELGLETTLSADSFTTEYTRMSRRLPIQSIYASTYLSTAQPFIDHLITPDNFQEIIALGRHFPGNLTSFLGFECRLTESISRADWAFAVSGADSDKKVLANLMNQGYIPDHFLQDAVWQRVQKFANTWANPQSALDKRIQCFWLEFDMPQQPPTVPLPSVFFGPTHLPRGVATNTVSEYAWLTRSALPLLKGHSIHASVKRQLTTCLQQLPENASLFQVGVMLSRGDNENLRLFINHLNPSQILHYLRSIGWMRDADALATMLSDLKPLADRFVLGYDITPKGIGPRLGLECSFQEDNYHQEPRWEPFLDYLVSKKLCLPEKRDALLRFPGQESNGTWDASIMRPLASISHTLPDLLSSTIVRYISHIKIVYENGKAFEAKAYPAVRLFKPSESSLYEFH